MENKFRRDNPPSEYDDDDDDDALPISPSTIEANRESNRLLAAREQFIETNHFVVSLGALMENSQDGKNNQTGFKVKI